MRWSSSKFKIKIKRCLGRNLLLVFRERELSAHDFSSVKEVWAKHLPSTVGLRLMVWYRACPVDSNILGKKRKGHGCVKLVEH